MIGRRADTDPDCPLINDFSFPNTTLKFLWPSLLVRPLAGTVFPINILVFSLPSASLSELSSQGRHRLGILALATGLCGQW